MAVLSVAIARRLCNIIVTGSTGKRLEFCGQSKSSDNLKVILLRRWKSRKQARIPRRTGII